MSDREQSLRDLAKKFAEAQKQVVIADRDFNGAERRRNEARRVRDDLDKELKGFVGRNIPRRVVDIKDGNVVLIQIDSHTENVYVSLEEAL